ncbi:MAG: hypothetical protein U1E39_16880 [Planctomycetota bacterium]
MRTPWLCAVALVGLAAAVRAEDGPPEPPAGRRVPTADVGKPYVGIRWERDFDEGMRRAAKEGRGVYLCENGRVEEGEGGTTMLWRAYQGADLGAATAGLVCFVVNATGHATVKAGREEVCARYGCGTCAAHRAASAFVMARFSADQSIVSPSHFLLDPDGRAVYQGEYMQSALSTSDLEAWFVRLSPRHALRSVWGAREARTSALGKAETAAKLQELATAWIASKDPMAAAGVVATLEQETDDARRKALFAALATAGPDALPVVWDAVDGVATDPDVDPVATAAWLATAARLDAVFGTWALTRALARTRATPADLTARCTAAGFPPASDAPGAEALRAEGAVLAAARAPKPDAAATDAALRHLEPAARAAGWPDARLAWIRAVCGKKTPVDLLSAGRDDVCRALLQLTPDEAKAAKAKLVGYLGDAVEEVRVAAAVALRRAGDPAGADVLLKAIEDPVEGPEVRWALTKLAGDDRGDTAGAWEEFVRAGGAK